MKAAWVGTTVCLHLEGTEAPRVEARWVDEYLSVSFEGGTAVHSISFRGTPQEVRLALAKGLAAVDRAVAERDAADPDAILPGEVDAGTEDAGSVACECTCVGCRSGHCDLCEIQHGADMARTRVRVPE